MPNYRPRRTSRFSQPARRRPSTRHYREADAWKIAVVSNVTSSTANGTITSAATVVPILVTFSEIVNVTGTPRILLETGTTDRYATYASGTGSATLTFNYTTVSGDTSADLDYKTTGSLELNGGTLIDRDGVAVSLTLPAPGAAGSLGANKAIVINVP